MSKATSFIKFHLHDSKIARTFQKTFSFILLLIGKISAANWGPDSRHAMNNLGFQPSVCTTLPHGHKTL